MVLLSPSIRGLRRLLNICEQYARDHGLKYNVKKTQMMVFRAGKGPERIPSVFLDGVPVERVAQFRYLGHILTEDLRDNQDMERERRALSVRCNMLARRFARCSTEAKLTLFRAYCQCFYTCQLWVNCTASARSSIRVQYNNAYRILMKLPKYCSASGMFADAKVPDYFAIIRSRVAAFWFRIRNSQNEILRVCSECPENRIPKYWLAVHRGNNRK
ncbi:uncharacterized protein LOC123867322 [Maniola jurtina]|uniref:uncharacterized protein LOC123867322 n=1 Tax=Maniola jurtina TaxID=191418 RepID=UPI001E68A647|nr:uncharacterized protein LOC123867322 [Maniola jurtina]